MALVNGRWSRPSGRTRVEHLRRSARPDRRITSAQERGGLGAATSYLSLPSAPSRWSRNAPDRRGRRGAGLSPSAREYRPGASPQCADRSRSRLQAQDRHHRAPTRPIDGSGAASTRRRGRSARPSTAVYVGLWRLRSAHRTSVSRHPGTTLNNAARRILDRRLVVRCELPIGSRQRV